MSGTRLLLLPAAPPPGVQRPCTRGPPRLNAAHPGQGRLRPGGRRRPLVGPGGPVNGCWRRHPRGVEREEDLHLALVRQGGSRRPLEHAAICQAPLPRAPPRSLRSQGTAPGQLVPLERRHRPRRQPTCAVEQRPPRGPRVAACPRPGRVLAPPRSTPPSRSLGAPLRGWYRGEVSVSLAPTRLRQPTTPPCGCPSPPWLGDRGRSGCGLGCIPGVRDRPACGARAHVDRHTGLRRGPAPRLAQGRVWVPRDHAWAPPLAPKDCGIRGAPSRPARRRLQDRHARAQGPPYPRRTPYITGVAPRVQAGHARGAGGGHEHCPGPLGRTAGIGPGPRPTLHETACDRPHEQGSGDLFTRRLHGGDVAQLAGLTPRLPMAGPQLEAIPGPPP